MQNALILATGLACRHCGWLLIKNGKLKCPRCRQEVIPTLGEKAIFCPNCRNPKILLAKHDSALCQKCRKETPIIKKEEKVEKKRSANVTIEVNIFEQLSRIFREKGISPEDLIQFMPYHLLNPAVRMEITLDEMRVRQVRRLQQLGYPKEVYNIGNPIGTDCLLVIPSAFVPIEQQVNILGLEDNTDIYDGFQDYVRTPESPYWIYGLSCELFNEQFTFLTMRDSLRKRKRRGLTFVEGLNLYAQYPSFFLRPCADMAGIGPSVLFLSSHRNDIGIPEISVWLYSDRPFVIGPNCYVGDKGNNDIVVFCEA